MSPVTWSWRRATALVTTGAFLLGMGGTTALAAGAESTIQIAHDPLNCVVTDLAPKIDAGVAPGNIFAKGYVYFKAAGTDDFYYAPMAGTPLLISGVLPRPLPDTKAIDYFVRATDVQDLAKKTPDYVPPVVPGNACKTKGVAVGKDGAGLTIGLTREGQNPAPPGFNRKDIAFIILFSGATVTLAEALGGSGSSTVKKGGGLSTGASVALGAVVVGAGALVIANNNKSKNATSTPTVTPTSTRTPTPTISFQFVEADATWSGIGNVTVEIRDPNGLLVGTNLPAGCESTASRTERVLLQGVLAPGTYRVTLTANDCPPTGGAPASIATALTVVQSGGAPKCPNTFINVPVGSTVQGCSFTIP
jgi:hypothetical protein